MRTKKMRLVSMILALAMLFAIAPVSAFAEDEVKPIEGLTFDATGMPLRPENANVKDGNTYVHVGSDGTQHWALTWDRSYLAIRTGHSFAGLDEQAISSSVGIHSAGVITGGVYNGSVEAYDQTDNNKNVVGSGIISDGVFRSTAAAAGHGKIEGGLFLGKISKSADGEITGGVFAQDPGDVSNKHTLTAVGCKIYTPYSYEVSKKLSADITTYINSSAYVVDSKNVVLTVYAPTLDHWEVNGVKVGKNDLATVLGSTAKVEDDGEGNITVSFTMPDNDVTVKPVAVPVEFHLDANGELPEYNGKTYMGSLELDGWKLDKSSGSYDYVLTVKQGTTVDFENHVVSPRWAFRNYGTIKNGITPGNMVNCEVTSTTYGDDLGKYGRVENIAFKMNVNFGDQDPNITWVTLKNATACEVFPDIVGVIGKQTITIKPTISADLFKGWVVGGDISDELAEQIEKQKDSDTLVLNLDGEHKDRIAVAAKTEGDTFSVKMLDGKATVDGQTVTAALPGQTVTITMDDSEIPEGMSFDHWVVSPDVELEGGFKATDRTTSFTMPTEELTIYASLRTDSDDGMDATTVLVGVAVGAGAAYLGYTVGTELYAKQVLGDGVAIPRTRADVALKAWELAGKPAVAVEGEPLSEAAQAEKWAIESGLMQNVDGSFNGQKKMSKLKALRTLDSAKKMNAQ